MRAPRAGADQEHGLTHVLDASRRARAGTGARRPSRSTSARPRLPRPAWANPLSSPLSSMRPTTCGRTFWRANQASMAWPEQGGGGRTRQVRGVVEACGKVRMPVAPRAPARRAGSCRIRRGPAPAGSASGWPARAHRRARRRTRPLPAVPSSSPVAPSWHSSSSSPAMPRDQRLEDRDRQEFRDTVGHADAEAERRACRGRPPRTRRSSSPSAEDGVGVFERDVSRGRQHQAPAGALEQRLADGLLQFLDLGADGLRRDVQRARGAHDGAASRDLREVPQVLEIEGALATSSEFILIICPKLTDFTEGKARP